MPQRKRAFTIRATVYLVSRWFAQLKIENPTSALKDGVNVSSANVTDGVDPQFSHLLSATWAFGVYVKTWAKTIRGLAQNKRSFPGHSKLESTVTADVFGCKSSVRLCSGLLLFPVILVFSRLFYYIKRREPLVTVETIRNECVSGSHNFQATGRSVLLFGIPLGVWE